jgi:predicted DNA-binding antitoxin AbrB/MazE fold protein
LTKKPKTTKPGTVVKVIQSPDPVEPEKAEIEVKGADPLYRELRLENALEGEDGKKVKLKKGAHVEITIEADPKETVTKSGH